MALIIDPAKDITSNGRFFATIEAVLGQESVIQIL